MSDKFETFLGQIQAGDWRAFAKVLTEIERQGLKALEAPSLLEPKTKAFRIGITGPPGAGKSTLVGQMIKEFRAQNLSVGVLAVDPSSPFSKGAILGDRIRFSEFSNDPKVFIRSLGSRGSLGGLSTAAYLMLRAFDWFGFDIVIVETVGVGQSELDILYVADQIAVVLTPESGDGIQAMKAGLLEIADIFIVNKSDRPGADAIKRELETLEKNGKHVEVFQTVATQGTGHQNFIKRLIEFQKSSGWKTERDSAKRLQWEAKELLRAQIESQVLTRIQGIKNPKDLVQVLQS